MNEQTLFHWLLIFWLIMAAAVFVILLFTTAPYGRHFRRGWGPTIGSRPGWVIMEMAAPLVFALCFISGNYREGIVALVFLTLWEIHYVHRAFIFPFTLRSNRRMPVLILSFGLLFNGVNGYLNGRYLFTFSGGYSDSWLNNPRFIIGVTLFVVGFIINRHADITLHNLRKYGEDEYKIPYSGLYRWVSCPNYLGEITIWIGWAVATWSLAGVTFALWTIANLVPRARSHHQWYQEHFPDYPSERKSLVPRLW